MESKEFSKKLEARTKAFAIRIIKLSTRWRRFAIGAKNEARIANPR